MQNNSNARAAAWYRGAVARSCAFARDSRIYTSVAIILTSAATPLIASAQDTDSAPGGDLEEVQVTGTRVVRDGYEAPTPLTVVGSEAIQTSGTPNVADYVNTIPSFAGSRMPTATNSSMSGGSSGMNALNLRSLGLNRTLILLDGRRVVGSTSDGIVDINLFPQNLISRVDVVTGGASAAYGSDAVAGVVNFILDKKFNGLKADVSGGMTDYSDDRTWDANFAYGTGFADDRGHFILAGEANHEDGVPVNDRPWNMQGWQYMTNPAYGTGAGQSRSVPERILVNQVSVDNAIAGGIITNTALKGTAFGVGGAPYQFTYGNLVRDPDMSGGDWRSATIRGTDLANGLTSRQETQNAFSRASFKLTDNVELFAQGIWARNKNHNWCCAKEDNADITIKSDNPFIPADVASRMSALNITQFTLGTMNADLPRQGASNDRRTIVATVGAAGSFDLMSKGWSWDAYYEHGVSKALQEATGIVVKSRFPKAIDAVRNSSGQIVCRVNADADPTNNDPGCVPYNVFGTGVNSSAVVDYLTGNGTPDFRDEKYTQDVAAASVNGEPFSTWAGPVSLAFGAEHRRDHVSGTNDPISQASDWFIGNYKVFTASNNVNEGFIETVVPLAEGMVMAKALDLNAAVRFTDYQNSGFVTTWKAGVTYTPIQDITFRGTRSRDIRAPNLQELYNAGAGGFPGVINPFRGGESELTVSSTVGNANLVPEESDYTGVGIVLQPRFVSGFSASVDYWNLNIDKAIGTITAQQTIDECFAGNQQVCNAITLGPGNTIDLIRLQPFNLVSQIARGIDYEASYRLPMSSLVPAVRGNLTLRVLATNYLKNSSNNGINTVTGSAGQNTTSGSVSGPPKWRWNSSVVYDNDKVSASLTARGISSGTYLNSNVVCSTDCPVSTADNRTVNNNYIAGSIYFDASIAYKFASVDNVATEVYFNVRNLTNKDPVIVAPGPGGFAYETPPVNASLYDVLGRIYRLGFRLKM
ncbi:MAG TPA: TonB-dependent receptor [Steroidobacteraceae bacterium]|nr:TonB-dependent receptor [Steroidobacteraceae bacterium]